MENIANIVYALSIINILGLFLLIIQSERRGKLMEELLIRVTRIETRYEGVPDHDDLKEVSEKISGLVTDVSTINERWQVTNRMMGTIQQHLLAEDKTK